MARHSIVALFRDGNGRTGKTKWFQNDATTTMATLFLPLSNAGLEGVKDIRKPAFTPTAFTVAPYQLVMDKAWMDWRTASALSPVKTFIPAPIAAMFGDQLNVDPTNAAVITYVNAALLVLTDNADGLVTSFVGGRRRNRHRKGL